MIPFLKQFANDLSFFVGAVIIAVQAASWALYWDEGFTTIITIGLAGLTTANSARKITKPS